MKGSISGSTLVMLFIVLLVFIIGLSPVLRETINTVTGDSLTTFILGIILPCFLFAIIAGIIVYSTKGEPQGY